jgi:Glutaredoxin and related proteins
MKAITMFETSWCPYCKQARKIMEELMEEDTKYKTLDIKIIDEEVHPEISKQYDYYYVPSLYVGRKKLLEGVPDKNTIRDIFEHALA